MPRSQEITTLHPNSLVAPAYPNPAGANNGTVSPAVADAAAYTAYAVTTIANAAPAADAPAVAAAWANYFAQDAFAAANRLIAAADAEPAASAVTFNSAATIANAGYTAAAAVASRPTAATGTRLHRRRHSTMGLIPNLANPRSFLRNYALRGPPCPLG